MLQVTFEIFREGFVNVLANAIDCLGDEGEDASEWSETGIDSFMITISKIVHLFYCKIKQ